MEKQGNETTEGFQKEFGKDRAIFVKCDVTKEEDLQSKNAILENITDILKGNG